VAAGFRLARFADGPRTFHALLDPGDRARPLSIDPFAHPDPAAWEAAAGGPRPIAGWTWLSPCAPGKVVGVGRNYREHAAELDHPIPAEPLLFLKPPSAVGGHGSVIRLPGVSRRVDYEGELGVVIGRAASRVSEATSLDHVIGYTCVNDVTARDLQKSDVQFTRAKGFDTFCPFGPCLATGLAPDRLRVETYVNGDRRQSAPTSSMIFGVARLVSYISHIMTLFPGDLIATGTPAGVGPLRSGDEVEVVIDGIGRLRNRVEAL
jgi:2-keto-4-pentenoate hydratase/2-oxohepta-3-ene-1,7-dioic acid hydratase in catechol pathway